MANVYFVASLAFTFLINLLAVF